jgi:secreted PhoX family phosphatase
MTLELEPTTLPGTRRTFIKGIAAAGASTMVAYAIDSSGTLDLFTEEARAATVFDTTPFMEFDAIGESSDDAFAVPDGFDADVLIRYGDTFTNDAGDEFTFGYNNDFLAYFPLEGSSDEGILFANHEYPDPFFMHGYKVTGVEQPGGSAKHTKSVQDIAVEKEGVGNSILHIKRDQTTGKWFVVEGSPYNRRIYGDAPTIPLTGPLAGAAGSGAGTPADPTRVGTSAPGSVANCSGGITPWGTALSCEENYDGYGMAIPSTQDFAYGWGAGYDQNASKLYGYVVEHNVFDPDDVGRKHTSLGRFRHENTAFRNQAGRKFVLYMGDDSNNEALYKFVSDRSYVAGDLANNLQILTAGTLYIAEWTDDAGTLGAGRTVYASEGGPKLSVDHGKGRWIKVENNELEDTRVKLRAKYAVGQTVNRFTPGAGAKHPAGANNDSITVTDANDYPWRFSMNRPEDVEVDGDGSVYIALTNNRGSSDGTAQRGTTPSANDRHGSVRRLVEDANDAEALTFTWTEFVVGGPRNTADPGRMGFSSPDNLTFDKHDNIWVVTDISSADLRGSQSPVALYDYHGNNAIFMIPRTGPNAGVAFRFANMPVEAEGTGPYFTPDEETFFISVQHPGEVTKARATSAFGQPSTYSSYWPRGSKTDAGSAAFEPLPAVIAITRPVTITPDPKPGNNGGGGSTPTPTPPAGPPSPVIPPRPADRSAPQIELRGVDSVEKLAALLGDGWSFDVTVDEAARIEVVLKGTVPKPRRRRGARAAEVEAAAAKAYVAQSVTLARATRSAPRAGRVKVTLKPSARQRAALRKMKRLSASLTVTVTDTAGNRRKRSRRVSFRR